jgi:hypothetical protein
MDAVSEHPLPLSSLTSNLYVVVEEGETVNGPGPFPIFGVQVYIYGVTPPVTVAEIRTDCPLHIVLSLSFDVTTASTVQLHVTGACTYGAEVHPFVSVTVTDVPSPAGIADTVTVLPETNTVPLVAAALKGPVPEFTVNVIE